LAKPAPPPSALELEKLRAFSPAAGRLISASPRLARTAGSPPAFKGLARASEQPKERAGRLLRLARKRLFVFTTLAELRGESPLVTARLWSRFADVALTVADAVVYRRLTARFGEPLGGNGDVIGRAIYGLGKLGAVELNPSSDVDLLFAYASDDGSCGDLSVHELFVRWVQGVRELLAHPDQDGFVFRVDLDLRPEGTTGPLINSLDALESYYERFGRTWERAALSRLRPIVDIGGVGEGLKDRLRPFVFPRTIDTRWVDDLAAMKQRVTDSAAAGGFDLKRGEGGIREVEFIVQALQMLHGGRDPALGAGSTVELLDALEARGLLPHRMARELREGYLALRRLEHALQHSDDRQTQMLPDGGPVRERLERGIAAYLGGPAGGGIDGALKQHTARVHAVFTAMLGEKRDVPSVSARQAVERTTPDEERLAALVRLGLEPADDALRLLRLLEKKPGSPFSPPLLAARSGLHQLAPRLLDDVAQSPAPMSALSRLPDLFSGFVHHSLLERLAGDRRLSSLLVRVLAVSVPLGRLLGRQAGLESVLLHGVKTKRTARAAFAEALAEGSDEEEARLVRMRRVQGRAVLAEGLAFLAGATRAVHVGHRLSTLADTLLEEGVALARRKVAARHGEPAGARFGVLGLGRLGGRELGFFADVDIVFLYDATGTTSGPKSIAASEWAARVAQQVIWALAAPLAEGRCYEVDTRLRPSGNQGPLVTTVEAFARYHDARAELWERQALLRLRPVAGDVALGRAAKEAARSALCRPVPERLGARLLDMRARMVAERAAPRGTVDVKMGQGGLTDIEFAVQGLQLKHAAEHPTVIVASTRRALHRLARLELISHETRLALEEGLERLSAVREALTLIDDRRGGVVFADDRRLSLLARAWPAAEELLDTGPAPSAEQVYTALVEEAARVRDLAHRVLVRL
jgi:[glutamine synthetase] adenylyltransferase / [glutamine synthetase]-adenylyl-L-tyrosine phosphorylase